MADQTKTIDIIVNTEQAVKSVERLNDSLENTQDETKQAKEDTKSYEKQLDKSSKEVGLFSDHLDKMSGGLIGTIKGLRNSVKGLKAFKVALAATGLGAIALIIGTVAAAFSKLQGPMSVIEDALAGIDAAFNQALKSLDLFGKAFLLFLQGNYAAALGVIGVAINDITEAFEEGSDLSKAQREFNLREAERNVIIARNNKLIEEQKLIYEDSTKSSLEREKAAKVARDAALKSVQLEKTNEAERLELARRQRDITTETDQDKIDFLETQSAGYEKIAGTAGRVVEINNAYNVVLGDIKSKLDAITAATNALDNEIVETKETYSEFGDISEEIAKNMEVQIDGTSAAAEATDDLTETQKDLNAALNVTGQSAQGVLDIIAGKTTGKDIFKFFLTSVGAILSLIKTTSGAGGVFSVIGNLFEDGGMLKGPSHKQGGIWVNAEGGEGIINKRSMSIPWVHSLASELNQIGGGVKFADGGIVAGQTAQEAQISQLSQSLQQQRTVLYREDVKTLDNQIEAIEYRSTL